VAVARTSRVADAIAAAGGTTGEANLAGINLASPLRDGEQIVVPSRAGGLAPEPVDDGRVHLNTASAGQLEAIPGVGPVLAARIIAVRTETGGFDTVEDLLDVPGIGEAKLAAMRDMVAVP
jgi:competence protein ComEA